MGINREGYRSYQGVLLAPGTRWMTLAVTEFRSILKMKWVKVSMLLSMIPLITYTIVLVVKALVSGAANVSLVSELDFLPKLAESQLLFVAVVASVGGAGLVAGDRAHNALVLYLSRPLSSARYLLGKTVAMAMALSIVYVASTLLYIIIELLVVPGPVAMDVLRRLTASILVGGVTVVWFSATIVVLSSLAKAGRFVGLAFFALYFISQAVGEGLKQVDGTQQISQYISLVETWRGLFVWVASPGSGNINSLLAAGVWLSLTGLGMLLVNRRLHAMAVST